MGKGRAMGADVEGLLMLERNPCAHYMKLHRFVWFNLASMQHAKNKRRLALQKTQKGLSCTSFTTKSKADGEHPSLFHLGREAVTKRND